jgi:Kdo2-lipid IVA lauroyltransferase/acyltransferase
LTRTRKRIIQWRDYLLLRSVMLLASPLSLRALQRLGGWLGLACWHVLPFRRQVVLANLRAAFGQECDEAELRARGRAFYRQLGTTLLEFCGYWRLTQAEILDLVEVTGREHLEATLALERGALLVSGHFGNWELLAAWVAASGTKVRFLVKSQSNQRVDALQNDLRRRAGVEVLRVGGTTREMVRILREGGVIGMLGDQDAGPSGLFLDFLGRPASVFRTAASLAWRLRCPVMTGFLVRLPDGRHRLDIAPALVPDPDWDEATAIATITRWHTQRLEEMVRRHPDHYFWVHRRWKTQPPPEAP